MHNRLTHMPGHELGDRVACARHACIRCDGTDAGLLDGTFMQDRLMHELSHELTDLAARARH